MTNSELMNFLATENSLSTTIHINDEAIILSTNNYTSSEVMKSHGKTQDRNHPEIIKIEVLVPN